MTRNRRSQAKDSTSTPQNTENETPSSETSGLRRSTRIRSRPKTPEIVFLGPKTPRYRKRTQAQIANNIQVKQEPIEIDDEVQILKKTSKTISKKAPKIPKEFKNFNFDCWVEVLPLNTPNFGIVFEIFQFLTRTDLDKCQLVCRTWKKGIQEDAGLLGLRPVEIDIKTALESCSFVAKERPGLWTSAFGFMTFDSKKLDMELNPETMPQILNNGRVVSLRIKLGPNFWDALKSIFMLPTISSGIERIQDVHFSCHNIQNLRSIPLWFKKRTKIEHLSMKIPFNFLQDTIADLKNMEKLEFKKLKLTFKTFTNVPEDIFMRSVNETLEDLGCDAKSREVEVNQFNWLVTDKDGFL